MVKSKHAGGRPTKLTAELIQKTKDYFENYQPYFECPVEKQLKDGTTEARMDRIANPPPSLFRLAEYLGVKRWSVWDWSDPRHSRYNKQFSNIITQGFTNFYPEILQENTLMGHYNDRFAIFCAKNRKEMNWKEKSEIGGTDGKAIEIIFNIPRPDKKDAIKN